MKLNKNVLKSLIMEVLSEDNLVSPLREEDIGASRALQILMQQYEQGGSDSVGFVSAANPPNKPKGWDDPTKMAELEKLLQAGGHRYAEIEGTYMGVTEPSFIVFGINRSTIVELGKSFLQDSVIWGEKLTSMNIAMKEPEYDPERDPKSPQYNPNLTPKKPEYEKGPVLNYRFEFINLYPERGLKYRGSETTDVKDVVLSDKSIQARTDNFSRFDRVKVLIPFFLDQYEPDKLRNVGPAGGKMTITDPEGGERRVRGMYEVKGE
jgi:hypothetical protein